MLVIKQGTKCARSQRGIPNLSTLPVQRYSAKTKQPKIAKNSNKMKLNITSAGKQVKFLHCETEFTTLSSESVYLFNLEGGYMRIKSGIRVVSPQIQFAP